MTAKQRAAEAAVQLLTDANVVGLGTGSTADCFLLALAAAIRDKRLRGIRGIPTSRQCQRRAQHLGIPLLNLADFPHPDITVDGADEIDPNLNLIKGLGGALVREKIVAQASRRLVIIADSGKRVPLLGTRSPLPVEVVPFAYQTHAQFLAELGAVATLRRMEDGQIFLTDNGNYIYDCKFSSIPDPGELEAKIRARAGVVECGLFLGIATDALIADHQKVEHIVRKK